MYSPIENDVDSLVAESLRVREQARILELKLNIVEEFGKDVFEPGIVIKFNKQWPSASGEPAKYEYVALKCSNNLWYTTGPMSKRGYTWQEFVLWLVSGDYPTRRSDLTFMVEAEDSELVDDDPSVDLWAKDDE